MKKCILALALTLAFSLAALAQSSYGGSSSQSQSSAQPSSSAQSSTAQSDTSMEKSKTSSSGKEHGVTGCLEQGSSPGTYVIKNSKHPEGVQVSYSGSEDLSKHVGHKVKATGSMSGSTLNATDVKHISETCSVSGGGEASSGRHHHGSEAGTSGTSGTESGTGTSTNPPAPK